MELDKLKKSRTVVRQATTRIINKLEAEINKDATEIKADIVEELLAQINAKEIALYSLDSEIEKLTKLENIEEEINGRETYSENIITWKTRANRILSGQAVIVENKNSTRSNTEIKNVAQTTVKLPRLQLSRYEGNILKFNDFWEQFKTAVHENKSLSDVERFSYLKSYLGGEAEIAISGLSLTEENYKISIDILHQNFGRKQLIIDAHMSKLLNLVPVRKSNETAALRRLYAECEMHIRGLQNLGIETNTYSCLLYPILLKTIPVDMTLEFTRRTRDKDETKISDLLSFLKAEIESQERTQNLVQRMDEAAISKKNAEFKNPVNKGNEKYDGNYKYSKPAYHNKEKYFKNKTPSVATFNTTAVNVRINKRDFCAFCEDATHRSENCPLTPAERKDRLIKSAKCWACLLKGHRQFNCFKKKICICGKYHNILICDQKIKPQKSDSQEKEEKQFWGERSASPAQKEDAAVMTNCSQIQSSNESGNCFLQTCAVEIKTNEKNNIIRMLCDVGSTKSFIIRECAEQLGLPIISQNSMKVFSFGETTPKIGKRDRVKITLRNPRNHKQTFTIEAILTDCITNAEIAIPNENIREVCNKRGIQLAEVCNGSSGPQNISLLLGSDFIWSFYTGKIKRFSENFVAVETLFGYCLSGTQGFNSKETVALHISTTEEQSESENRISEQLKQFWQLESLGIIDSAVELSKPEIEVIEEFKRGIKFKDSRYEVKLPWKSTEKLSNNFNVAKKRLLNLVSRFKSDNRFFEDYDQIIKDQLSEGIIEHVPFSPNFEETSDKVYFMPHQGIVRVDKVTSKLRIVFDCSAHEKNYVSLNHCLNVGPNLNPNLLTILLKFRSHKVAFVSDIEKAFLMVSVAKEDRDCLRFLWIEDPFEENLKLTILRSTRVTFGVCSSPFLLAATIKHHIEKYKNIFPNTFSMLDSCLYVDDFIGGTEGIQEASVTTVQAKKIMEEASMKLRKWQTNSEELEEYWKTEKFDISKEDIHQSPLKVLGISWNNKADVFKLELSTVIKLLKNDSYTKRKVLQTTCTVFDPIGYISPFLIRMKILFQKLWERGLKWDDELPDDLQMEWKKWCNEVPDLENLKIPRPYVPTSYEVQEEETELHIFCDASEAAYGAVAYLRFKIKTEGFHVSFVMAKARVAPLKRLTLPRLELMAAVIASRLADYLKKIFCIEDQNRFLWSDSNITLSWIRGHANDWKPFVSNRVVEVQSLTDPHQWNHCSGRENPADLLTRGCTAEKVIAEEKWWCGPSWLKEDKICWPKFKTDTPCNEACEQEKRRVPGDSVQLICQSPESEPLFDIKRYSNLHKVLRITAWIFRFASNARLKSSNKTETLTTEELCLARNFWIKKIQEESYPDELKNLKLKGDINSTSKLYQFNPFLDEEGILRIGGRLQHANLTFDITHPILLPYNSYFSDLVIILSHHTVGHGGVGETLTQLRDKFWMIKGRQRVKTIIGRCLTCRRFKVKPATQDMAPLPPDRLNETFPFEVCGVDFAGPLYIKDGGGKAYIALFTCAVTRAVHLETVSNLTTENFLLALRRFVSRRGICRKIYSDNAQTFKRADKDLQSLFKLIEDPKVKDFLGRQEIQWKYIVERASWWGGFWERLVRSTKTCLKKVILKALLKFEELETVLTEVEAILNSRPLTYVYSEDTEPEPLTPGHFLVGRRLISLPSKTPGVATSTRETLTRRYKYKLAIIDRFWRRWQQQYLLELRSAHEMRRTKSTSSLSEKDIVFIHDEKQPKLMWKMGVITQVHPGRDGKVRSCTVRLSNGTILKRPVQLIYPLELSDPSD